MIIGKGLMSSAFENIQLSDYIIFASGVSDSTEIKCSEFKREKDLLSYYLENFKDKTLVYFNSLLTLSNIDTPYFNHKRDITDLIKKYDNYKIYNVPQILGNIGNKNNLVNYLIHSLKEKKFITIQKDTYRSIIDVGDLKDVVLKTLETNYKIFNISHIELLTVMDILKIISNIYNIEPNYIEIENGVSTNIENDEIIDEILKELNIEKDGYTKKIIEKYLK